ncbi:hypothetical protein BaRGS_00021342 [Batillaria attramentaria]|uniref:Uncharacterized protein n=1 Tax=Batillaria attramentaria TaxID=370345 RepID=A0ABD0KJK4_9CAEN
MYHSVQTLPMPHVTARTATARTVPVLAAITNNPVCVLGLTTDSAVYDGAQQGETAIARHGTGVVVT